jgi:hypothetical protein
MGLQGVEKSLGNSNVMRRNKSDKILNVNYANLVQCHKISSKKVAENNNIVKRGLQGVGKSLRNSNVMQEQI